MDQQINHPGLWLQDYPWPEGHVHKYQRGTVLVAGGGSECTGAARLAALAALRSAAGLTAIACPREALPIYAAACLAVMVRPYDLPLQLKELFEQPRYHTLVIGPGHGVGATTRAAVLDALATGKPTLLDADALTSFAGDDLPALTAALHPDVLITPHEGEFESLFGAPFQNTLRRIGMVVETARNLGCTVLLKGASTVIARADGDYRLHQGAPATLATAGSGDVLAGICGGLMAAGMTPYQAASMGVWLHGEAAKRIGYGLIAEDLPDQLPAVLNALAARPDIHAPLWNENHDR